MGLFEGELEGFADGDGVGFDVGLVEGFLDGASEGLACKCEKRKQSRQCQQRTGGCCEARINLSLFSRLTLGLEDGKLVGFSLGLYKWITSRRQ